MHYPRKRFGQHFLKDPNVVSRIISVIAPRAEDIFVEIGPGKGVLTYPLLNKVARIYGVEIDRDLARMLEQKSRPSDKLQVHCGDALKVDYAKLSGKRHIRFVGNIPYNISTPLIFRLAAFQDYIIDIHLMLQREVVQRLIAPAGDKHYGRLGVIARCCFEIEALFDVFPESFTPPPKVVSTFTYFKPRPRLPYRDLKELDKIVRLAFANRRKTSANALSELFGKEDLEYLGIDPYQRADNIEPGQFLYMLKYLNSNGDKDATE